MMKTHESRASFARLLVVSCALAGLAWAEPAEAQSGNDAAAAEALFREGRALMAEEQYERACPKFAASQRLDGGYGTLYNLGNCYELTGKTASAWATFGQARDLARRDGQAPRVEKAERRTAALEPRLIRMSVTVSDAAVGTRVTRDGAVIDPAGWGTPLPVDPGPHDIVVTAPGRREYKTQVTVSTEGSVEEVVIPALDLVPEVERPTTPAGGSVAMDADSDDRGGLRTGAYVAGGVGILGLGIGTVLGLLANSKWNDALDNHCQSESLCTQEGLDLTDDAKSFAGVSTVSFILGGIGTAAGITLFVTSMGGDEPAQTAWTLTPSAGPDEGVLLLQGSF